jgi:ABC-type bacteriocin/lantibiotic exporter with double-glycine peptidase domain
MYEVPGMKLIPQQKNMSCWYASAQMVIQWQREQTLATWADHPDPSQVNQAVQWEIANNGIVNPRVLQLAKFLGLRSVPPMTLTLAALEGYMRTYGPLWTNGKAHIVVVAGIDGQKLKVYDPWPVGKGKVEWRSLTGWYFGNDAVPAGDPDSSRDTGADVEATFLYHP